VTAVAARDICAWDTLLLDGTEITVTAVDTWNDPARIRLHYAGGTLSGVLDRAPSDLVDRVRKAGEQP
jgi:hypothetical protein